MDSSNGQQTPSMETEGFDFNNLSKSVPFHNGSFQHQQHQHQQQSQQQQPLFFNNMNLNTLESTLLSFNPREPIVKQEPELDLDPTDPFAINTDFGDLLLQHGATVGLVGSVGQQQQQHQHQQHQNSNQVMMGMAGSVNGRSFGGTSASSVLSPLSTSPLDHDLDNLDDFTPHSAHSLSGSPYGSAPSEIHGHSHRHQQPTPAASAPRSHNLQPAQMQQYQQQHQQQHQPQQILPRAGTSANGSGPIVRLQAPPANSPKPSGSAAPPSQHHYSVSMPAHGSANGFAAAMEAKNAALGSGTFGARSLKETGGSVGLDDDQKT
ncbi:hypothetical protein HK101_010494, partial [Irineochytrium annulatum]